MPCSSSLDEATIVPRLAELPLWVRSIVTHPDAISDPGSYRRLGTRLVMENMDDRKRTGRIADEMESFFVELPEAGFCRLRQVHLSSLSGGHHVPLRREDEDLFADVLDRCCDVPWILEAEPPERWGAQLEGTILGTGGSPPAMSKHSRERSRSQRQPHSQTPPPQTSSRDIGAGSASESTPRKSLTPRSPSAPVHALGLATRPHSKGRPAGRRPPVSIIHPDR